MEPQLVIIALALAALVGVSLGLLGGGGSILTVPILTYVLGMDPREAIAASLFIVGVTSLVGMISHARAGRVRWRTGLIFGLAGMAGAFAGGVIGGYIPGAILMILFAVMMIVTATAMIRGRKTKATQPGDEPAEHKPAVLRILLDGFGVGIATGLVGAGGGFLVVPALNLLGGLPMAIAIGTSLLVIAMKSFAGLGGYLLSTQVQWPIVLAFTGIAILGSFVGVALAGRIPEKALRKAFGIFVLVMGAFVLFQELPPLIASLFPA
ncbi:sulfite exporter TauE/SafE family protein [Gulosibacter molinativorax]|uniref:Probable membrane transporter protein n=1 Tax=Gulosibacter molinativorax TaxID=256821 RepID=A0ABT7CBT4_9MICO|nr:sulfite exporter TauE/SafE family protein [Gulosibacter molinativorax]MDJ1372604.1 sulfite exporter TauE/SafE family protein [Gulosibacter molinativorax]QUY62266.1 transmembrane protein [Gulosibacter molinativorax]